MRVLPQPNNFNVHNKLQYRNSNQNIIDHKIARKNAYVDSTSFGNSVGMSLYNGSGSTITVWDPKKLKILS